MTFKSESCPNSHELLKTLMEDPAFARFARDKSPNYQRDAAITVYHFQKLTNKAPSDLKKWARDPTTDNCDVDDLLFNTAEKMSTTHNSHINRYAILRGVVRANGITLPKTKMKLRTKHHDGYTKQQVIDLYKSRKEPLHRLFISAEAESALRPIHLL